MCAIQPSLKSWDLPVDIGHDVVMGLKCYELHIPLKLI